MARTLILTDGGATSRAKNHLMLQEFITTYREAIIRKAREKLTARPWPSATPNELENGVPSFLSQLSDALRGEATGQLAAPEAMQATATSHGRDLLALGFTVSQVVHDYGDICQAVTELALDQHAPITTAEFRTLNRCLDTAIAEAVTEHARMTAAARATDEAARLTDAAERSAHVAHETRDLLNTALLAFATLKRGTVAINGSTGAVLGRSLLGLRQLVDSTLSDIRLAAPEPPRERVVVAPFLHEIAAAGALDAEDRGLDFVVEPIDPGVAVAADPQLLGSAVLNLLNNAFKYTRAHGRVVLRAHHDDRTLRIEVEDECGGLPDDTSDLFQAFARRRGRDRTGLGLGLSMAQKAVRAHGGDIHVRNRPGQGCVFVIEVPVVDDTLPAALAATIAAAG